MVWRNAILRGTRIYWLIRNVTNVARAITKMTAAPIPKEVEIRVDTPKKGQIPRNWVKTMLFTNIAEMINRMYSMAYDFAGLES